MSTKPNTAKITKPAKVKAKAPKPQTDRGAEPTADVAEHERRRFFADLVHKEGLHTPKQLYDAFLAKYPRQSHERCAHRCARYSRLLNACRLAPWFGAPTFPAPEKSLTGLDKKADYQKAWYKEPEKTEKPAKAKPAKAKSASQATTKRISKKIKEQPQTVTNDDAEEVDAVIDA